MSTAEGVDTEMVTVGIQMGIDNKPGTWVVQSVKHPNLDFGSGPDPRVGS